MGLGPQHVFPTPPNFPLGKLGRRLPETAQLPARAAGGDGGDNAAASRPGFALADLCCGAPQTERYRSSGCRARGTFAAGNAQGARLAREFPLGRRPQPGGGTDESPPPRVRAPPDTQRPVEAAPPAEWRLARKRRVPACFSPSREEKEHGAVRRHLLLREAHNGEAASALPLPQPPLPAVARHEEMLRLRSGRNRMHVEEVRNAAAAARDNVTPLIQWAREPSLRAGLPEAARRRAEPQPPFVHGDPALPPPPLTLAAKALFFPPPCADVAIGARRRAVLNNNCDTRSAWH